jgi:hypothetical protein
MVHNVSEKQLLKQLFVHVGAPFFSYVLISAAALVQVSFIDQDTRQLSCLFFMSASLEVATEAENPPSLRDRVVTMFKPVVVKTATGFWCHRSWRVAISGGHLGWPERRMRWPSHLAVTDSGGGNPLLRAA